MSYGIAEVLHGYGFVSVFVTACVIRAAERSHGYHKVLHEFTEQIERLLTAVLLFLLGGYLVAGALSALTLMGAVLGVLVLLVVRPLTGWLAQVRTAMGKKESAVVALFGIRGIGSLFYLSYALGQDSFGGLERELWAIVALTVVISVVLYGPVLTKARGEHGPVPKPGRRGGGQRVVFTDPWSSSSSLISPALRARTNSRKEPSSRLTIGASRYRPMIPALLPDPGNADHVRPSGAGQCGAFPHAPGWRRRKRGGKEWHACGVNDTPRPRRNHT
jgi:hypothetical protein